MQDRMLVPLIVASALFMQNLDSTVVATALPAIAQDFGANPIHLKLALTTYLLTIAVFLPASGWMADRFGARQVFRSAIAIFIVGSVLCGLSRSIEMLVFARIVQGIGGSMMVPVGRLVVLRTVKKSELVTALSWLTVPALIGPILGPAGRRVPDHLCQLAVDLLDQRAGRLSRHRAGDAGTCPTCTAKAKSVSTRPASPWSGSAWPPS